MSHTERLDQTHLTSNPVRSYFNRIPRVFYMFELEHCDNPACVVTTELGISSCWYNLPEHGLTPPSELALKHCLSKPKGD